MRVKKPLIETVGLTKVYDVSGHKITAVSDVSLSIDYGDFVMVFGPSGSGKSTLLNMILGLEEPDLGEVYIKGESFFDLNEEERAFIRLSRFGIIPQKQIWLNQLSVIDNVGLPLVLLGEGSRKAREKADYFLKKVGMEEVRFRNPSELSVGQQQKVAIARSLVNNPWLLFADEPISNLDKNSSDQVMDLLKEVHEKDGITIIMVTHDLRYLNYGKRWLFVDEGKLSSLENDEEKNPLESFQSIMKTIEEIKKRQ